MTSGGVEALKAAIRRSLLLIVALIVLGIVAVNVFTQVRGPQYEANARVLISTTPLTSIITGTQPSFVDPARLQQTAIGIADSSEIYAKAAGVTNNTFGTAEELEAATTVVPEQNSDLITFTSESDDPDQALGIVNSVAGGYVSFRDDLSAKQIEEAVAGLESSLSALPAGESARLETQLNKLLVLQENSGDAQVVQEATTASKTSPAPLQDSLVGLSIGMIVALLVVALREAIDTTVRSEGDVEEVLSTSVLASVRSLPRRKRMVTYGRHEAEFADAYALLAAQLTGNSSRDGGPLTLAVTSSMSREGKTTTASNLAVAIARRGSNVILADFDFRKPAMSDVFGLPENSHGALQVMAGSASLQGALWAVSLQGSRPRVARHGSTPPVDPAEIETDDDRSRPTGSLKLLPAGGVARAAPQPSRLNLLVQELRARADVVIFDTPPALLTVEVAELSRLIDTIVVVVRQGRVSQRSLRTLQRQTRTWKASLAGAVMTDVQTEGKYSYYGGR